MYYTLQVMGNPLVNTEKPLVLLAPSQQSSDQWRQDVQVAIDKLKRQSNNIRGERDSIAALNLSMPEPSWFQSALLKRGKGYLATWKQRWCVLDCPDFMYFEEKVTHVNLFST
jgi:hypothetical protein